MSIQEGQEAPSFELQDIRGRTIRLSDYLGRNRLVLYFYPKDDTPGCTVEACGFRDSIEEIEKAGAVVLGVSTDAADSHLRFKGKHGLNFPLLTDGDGSVARAYGAWDPAKGHCRRVTAVIGLDGRVLRYFPQVTPEGHAEEILNILKTG